MANKCLEHNITSDRSESPKINLTIDNIISSKDSDTGSHANPIRRHIKYGTSFQASKGILLEYFNDSTIHGFKYIGDEKRSTIERVIWLFALVLSICTCCYLISNIWEKRNSTPVIITFNEKLMPVWEIPFPSLTICPGVKSHAHIFNYSETFWKVSNDQKNITEEEQYYWDAISQTCFKTEVSYGNLFSNASKLEEAMSFAAPTLNDTFHSCIWNSLFIDCEEIFEKVIHDEGICFRFNSFRSNYFRDEYLEVRNYGFRNSSDWNLERGYDQKAGQNTFPFRVLGSSGGVSVMLMNKKQNDDETCNYLSDVFTVHFQTPGEDSSLSFKEITVGQTVSISLTAEVVNSSEGVRDYDSDRRQCYFQKERYLRYFNVYTQSNCELECNSNRTLEVCGCVSFFMPRNASHKVCGAKKIDCIYNVSNNFYLMNFEQKTHPNQFNDSNSCNCLPTCTSIQYKVELEDQVPLKVGRGLLFSKTDDFPNKNPGIQLTVFNIDFKEDTIKSLKRSELYSTTDFIANCGGLLGLFMGVSILSLVELVYSFTIRLWLNLKMRRMKQQELRKFKAYA